LTKASEKFERQIERINKLIEQPGSEITWNDRLPDPDNPSQHRQIDISIRRDNKLTLVECRLHKEKQDVKWIEELIGRRLSLHADAVIAVSASGFTEGAISKAKTFGIILRDILSLTEEEISKWGCRSRVTLIYYEFTNIELAFVFEHENIGQITTNDIEHFLRNRSHNNMMRIMTSVANIIDKNKHHRDMGDIRTRFSIENLTVREKKVIEICFVAHFRTVKQEIFTPSVVVYDAPNVDALKRNVFIEVMELGDFEITHSINKAYAAIDLTQMKTPPNCIFREVLLKFSKPLLMDRIGLLGPPNIETDFSNVRVRIGFAIPRSAFKFPLI